MNRLRLLAGAVVAIALGIGVAPAKAGIFTSLPVGGRAQSGPIQHVVFIVQENRSFDHFFGTFPGADGLPANPPCQVDPWYPTACDTPFPNHVASNQGGPYMNPYQVQDIDGGKMDGFVESREQELGPACQPSKDGSRIDPHKIVGYSTDEEGIKTAKHCINDVMGYHTKGDIPNYWAYASKYVLFDHFFESAESWSLPAHLALFSGWAAQCTQLNPPNINSCSSNLEGKDWDPTGKSGPAIPYLWTDITYLLYQNNISWAAYLDGTGLGLPVGGKPNSVQGIWIPLGGFQTVNQDGQYANAIDNNVSQFLSQATAGTLPAVSWVIPDYTDSDHPQTSVKHGEAYVTNLINTVMAGPDWQSTAIFLVWDDMGGFYDHEPPPFSIDFDGPGLRIPAILISPYAKPATIDHQILTTDSFLTFIEDVFAGGESICQTGRPDPRPDCRDQSQQLGNLMNDFNFNQKPVSPLFLSTHPMSTLIDNDEDGIPPSIANPRPKRLR